MNYVKQWWNWSIAPGFHRKLIGLGIPAFVAALVVTVAASGNTEEPAASTAQSTTAPITAGQDRASREDEPSGCVPISPSLLALLERHITAAGQGRLTNAQAFKSKDYESVWMIGAVLDYPGFEGEAAVWAIDTPNPSTLNLDDPNARSSAVLSVDGFAKEFSDWFHGDETDFDVRSTDHGVEEARACAKK